MENKELKVISEEKLVTKSITCNKCGHTDWIDDNGGNYYFQRLNCDFGYGSKFDMEGWEFHLCEECLIELVKKFKHAPLGFGDDSMYGYYEDSQEDCQKSFEEWKKNFE